MNLNVSPGLGCREVPGAAPGKEQDRAKGSLDPTSV